jgi:hypothetical protein
MIVDTHRMVRDYSGQDSTTRTTIPFLRPDIIKCGAAPGLITWRPTPLPFLVSRSADRLGQQLDRPATIVSSHSRGLLWWRTTGSFTTQRLIRAF